MKRKEMQIRELQQRLENGEGCKSNLCFIRLSIFKIMIFVLYNVCGGGGGGSFWEYFITVNVLFSRRT